ncbi:helix-turn-helix domain containing protein, partial [Candidatus Gracilibacteria bacterium]|nr:helix-turn-helix domain containing protein [Candidatus Gracilibacteria bacterium]
MPNVSWTMTELRIKLVQDIVSGKRKIKEVSEILGVSRQSVSKWKAKFLLDGETGLIPKKSGPKKGNVWNKTPSWLEDEICCIAQ